MNVEDLTLSYGNKIVLDGVSFEVGEGDFVFIIGSSGSGKTSLIRALTGDLRPSSGDVIIGGDMTLYKNFSPKKLRNYRRSIGVIFQDYKLLESKTVYENVAFAMEVSGYKEKVIIKRVPEILQQVGLLTKKDNFVSKLSGGEKQRVSIARALVHDPSIIIGDEPTGNLDPHTALNIMSIFEDLNISGKTIIIATHSDNIVNQYKKRVITFRDKQIFSDIEEGTYNL